MKKVKRNKSEFERILDEIEGREQFHHMDGEDYEVYEEYEDNAGMSQPQPQKRLYKADPYQIVVNNPTDKALKAVIYGHDKFLLKNNFGSDSGIEITTGQTGVEYVELLQRSARLPFKIQHIRVESDNTLQLSKPMVVNWKNGRGRWEQWLINMQIYRSAYQTDKNIIDIDRDKIDVDGSTYLEVEIEPKTRIFYSIFPYYEVDTADTLRGKDPIKAFANAKVNTGAISIRPKKISG
ncbi:hypothetical protein [Parvicella tangerina]|uniref:Uncharacterized protein n=1 Tax=Parvicella tangerina TaxID=2829795 RepID=A0A916JP65_9FLAO|nr:hypothetical protein [Parvicella tangerina]CAG5082287.1 hypothetical protein CRYO30217_01866 [Parvicella tangerina]